MKSKKIIKATPNYHDRTYTIRTYWDKKITQKYRTTVMSKEEFENNLDNTQSDWQTFLRYGYYYHLKTYI